MVAIDGDDRARLGQAFLICFSREPSDAETNVLLKLLAAEQAELEAEHEDAGKIAGQSESGDIARLAAWTVVCRTLLGLDEFVTRE